jgi:MFS family permease
MTAAEVANAPEAETGRLRQGAGTTFAAFLGLTFGPSAIAVLAFGVFVSPIQAEFGWSRVQVSLAATVVSYMIMLVAPLQGWLTDRFGVRRTVLVSIPAFAAAMAAFYFQPRSLPAFYLLWAIVPAAAAGLWPLSYLKAVSGWFDRRLGLALGVANAGVGVGSALVPVIAAAMILQYGWRTAFVALAAIILVVTWPVAFFLLREAPDAGAETLAKPVHGVPFDAAAKSAAFRLLALGFFLLGLSTTALITQQAPMLIDAGWSPARAAAVQSVFGLGLMAGRLGVGYLLDKIFAPFVIAGVALCGAIGCVLYAAMPGSQLAFLSSTLVGLVVGAEFDVLSFLIKRYFGPCAFGKLYGAVFAVFQLACGIGIVALSSARVRFGHYTEGFYAFAVILTLAAFVFTRLPRYGAEAT